MKWTYEDMDMFIKAKEYIDTVVLPLCPISFEDNLEETVGMSEFISLLTVPLEKQFKGRLLLLPRFTYLKGIERDLPFDYLLKWESELLQAGFKHIFYLTGDNEWVSYENKLNGTLITIFETTIHSSDRKYQNIILEDKLKELKFQLAKRWQTEE
ncbi:DUF2487 family protein [Niallia sp. XMNu-256]|uniref:DUF2487 family protein n=1 Tax=Niallia sp. XMNu-256 TaxID=3082444 RepID=UPI0030CBC938